MRINPLLNVDSYKHSHTKMYPPGMTVLNSYIESRGVAPGRNFTQTVVFGLQMFLKEYMSVPFTIDDVIEAEEIVTAHGEPFDREGFEWILAKYNGFWPVKISAVEEGTILPPGHVMVQVISTDDRVPWVTNFIETELHRAIWYPTTVATLSWHIKQDIRKALNISADDLSGLLFKLHDFGGRGASSNETAMIGGLAHLVNFRGTDTMAAIVAGRKYYGEQMAGFSIPAAEHSTVTSWGGEAGELASFEYAVDNFAKPGKMFAVVSDSYNLWRAIDKYWGESLRDKIVNSGATLVVRPDSGDPLSVPIETVQALIRKFGMTVNKKKYQVLPSCIRVIQGDGVNRPMINIVIDKLLGQKLSMDNLAFGMGAELLQKVNRDDLKFAMKASSALVNGEWIDVYKDPITDPGKTSKKGILALVRDNNGVYKTVTGACGSTNDLLTVKYWNGKLFGEVTLADVRARSEEQI